MSLQLGQIVRYEGSLWRVDFINDCRARIVPLTKRHVVLPDGRAFDTEVRGVNISPNSVLDTVEDPDRAATELELARAEAELADLRRQVERPVGDWKPIVPAFVGSLKHAVQAHLAAHPNATPKEVHAAVAAHGATLGAVTVCVARLRGKKY